MKIFHRFWLKISCLVLAVILWSYVQGKETGEVNSIVRIKLVSRAGLTVAGSDILTKDVTISGPRGALKDYINQPIQATIQLPAKKGIFRQRINKQHFNEPLDSMLKVDIHEEYVQVKVEEIRSKTLPIKVSTQGAPKDGYLVEKTSTRPSNITISGAASSVASLDHIDTQPVNIDGIAKDMTQEVDLVIPGNINTMFSEDKAFVSVRVGLEKINRLFSDIPIDVQENNLLSRPVPESVSVLLQSNSLILDSIKPEQLRAFVQAEELPPGHYELEVLVQIPQSTTLIEAIPAKVSVTLWEDKKLPRSKSKKSPKNKRKR